jgi:hypothetical protein
VSLTDAPFLGKRLQQEFLVGLVDEVSFYDRALEPAEIQAIVAAGGAGKCRPGVSASFVVGPAVPATVYPGETFSVDLSVQHAVGLYAAQATCRIDSSAAVPVGASFGNLFHPDQRIVGANRVDPPDTWLGAVGQRNPAGPVSGSGSFATVSFLAQAPGNATIACDPLFSDRDGTRLDVAASGEPVVEVLPFGSLSGSAGYQGRESRTLSAVTVSGGDLNGDEAIDIGDATLLGANFGRLIPPADPLADINGDSVINVQDLAILAGNYDLRGCHPACRRVDGTWTCL